MRFHKTNDISQNFSGVTLGFHEILKYFLDFCFHFRYFRKMTPKFQCHSYRCKISKFQTWQWRKFKKSISQLPNSSCSLFPFVSLFYLIGNKSIAKFISLTVYFCSSNFAHPNSVRHFNWEFFRG
jgi:hypothetical protein